MVDIRGLIGKVKESTKSSSENHPHHHHINLLLIISIFLILIIIIFMKSAFVGYKMTKQFEDVGMSVSEFMKAAESTKSELLISNTNLDSCKGLNQQYLNDLSKEKNQTFICNQENAALNSRYNQLSAEFLFNVSRIKSEFDQKTNEIKINLTQFETRYNDLRSVSDAVITNAANNICCKTKVDNKNIDSYIISNGMIICTTGEANKIIC